MCWCLDTSPVAQQQPEPLGTLGGCSPCVVKRWVVALVCPWIAPSTQPCIPLELMKSETSQPGTAITSVGLGRQTRTMKIWSSALAWTLGDFELRLETNFRLDSVSFFAMLIHQGVAWDRTSYACELLLHSRWQMTPCTSYLFPHRLELHPPL